MKQNNKLPSYTFDELVPDKYITLLILVEEPHKEGIYNEVRATEEQLKKIGDILNTSKLGYRFQLYETNLIVEPEVDMEND